MNPFLLWLCLLFPSACTAQSIKSPEVLPDGRVTFRCKAPNAKEVVVESDILPKLEMTKDENGVWSVTTGPLAPDYYNYFFVIDHVAFADPANADRKAVVTGGAESILHVPGPSSLSWERNDVPHGVISRHRYRSRILGEDRDFYVYTPPSYSSSKGFPVVYLLHGVMEDETAWEAAGKASVILDNLIARQKAMPMIVVMPNGYGFANVPDNIGQQFGGTATQRKIMDAFTDVLLTEIEPQVAREYRTSKDRAIAGSSMGGAQALYIGLNHSDKFGWVGAFSPAVIMYGLPYDPWFPAIGSRYEQTVFTYCGTKDFLILPFRKMNQWLSGKAVKMQTTETEGAHTWNVWRRNLEDFAERVFQAK